MWELQQSYEVVEGRKGDCLSLEGSHRDDEQHLVAVAFPAADIFA